jgi:GNAT superfamily N-acetyltransferase
MITATSAIRPASTDDLETMVGLGLRFDAEKVYPWLTMSEDSIRTMLTWVLGHGRIWVAEKDDVLVGGFGMTILPHLLTGQPYAAEVFWWTNPEARGHGLKLFYAAEQWAIDQGVTMLQMVAPTPEAEDLYVRLGFHRIEAVYSKEFLPC